MLPSVTYLHPLYFYYTGLAGRPLRRDIFSESGYFFVVNGLGGQFFLNLPNPAVVFIHEGVKVSMMGLTEVLSGFVTSAERGLSALRTVTVSPAEPTPLDQPELYGGN